MDNSADSFLPIGSIVVPFWDYHKKELLWSLLVRTMLSLSSSIGSPLMRLGKTSSMPQQPKSQSIRMYGDFVAFGAGGFFITSL